MTLLGGDKSREPGGVEEVGMSVELYLVLAPSESPLPRVSYLSYVNGFVPPPHLLHHGGLTHLKL